MNDISWKYVKPLANEESIAEYEAKAGISLPDDIKLIVRQYNGGRPSLKYYDLPTEKDKEFKSLLSFNRSDLENVFKLYPLDSANKKLVPFATDSAGNCFVVKNGTIHLWLHELDRTIFIAETISAFLEMLHD